MQLANRLGRIEMLKGVPLFNVPILVDKKFRSRFQHPALLEEIAMARCILASIVVSLVATVASAAEDKQLTEDEKEIASLTKQLQSDPNEYSLWFNRGLAHEGAGKYDNAIADYTRALHRQTDYSRLVGSKAEYQAHALHYRGRVYHWHKRDLVKALADYSECVKLHPSTEMVHYRRGQVLSELKKYGEAERDFKEALRRDPDYSNLLSSWAWQMATCPNAKYRNGAKAMEMAKRANETFKMRHSRHMDVLAACYAETGKFDEAVKAQQKAIDLLKGDRKRKKAMEERLAVYKTKRPYRTK